MRTLTRSSTQAELTTLLEPVTASYADGPTTSGTACPNGPSARPRPTPLGRLARRGVEIHQEPESSTFEARQGGLEGDGTVGCRH